MYINIETIMSEEETAAETDVIRTGDTAHKQKLMLSEQVTQHTNRN